MLSNMRYHTAVIISLFSACGSLAASSRKMMKLTAYADRLQQLENVAKEISSGAPGQQQCEASDLVLQSLAGLEGGSKAFYLFPSSSATSY